MELWNTNFDSEERLHKRIMKVGEMKGRTSGLKQGRKEGISTGIKSVATNLLKNNAPINLIIKSTGLSKKEINKLAINI